MTDYKNILIVRTDRVGDVVLTTPAIRALRGAYPHSRISILVAPRTRDLVEGNPDLDEVLVDDRGKEHKGPFGFLKLVYCLRQKKFDLAIIFHTKKRTNLTCFLAGIPSRIGYKNNKLGFLLTHPLRDTRHEGKKHEVQYCLDVLQELGITAATHWDLYVPVKKEAEQWVEQFCREHRISAQDRLIAIHAGASDPSRRWPEERFADLIDKLIEDYSGKIVIIGTADIRKINREIISLAHHPVLDLTGMMTISQLVSLFKRCDLLISNDSGPVHIAAAVGTPVIAIFTRNQPGINPERWRPLAQNSKVISVPPTGDISFTKAQPIDTKFQHPQFVKGLELIPTQEVLESVDALFKLC